MESKNTGIKTGTFNVEIFTSVLMHSVVYLVSSTAAVQDEWLYLSNVKT